MNTENLVGLWAKLARGNATPTTYHPLPCHLIDVACVTGAMWRHSVAAPARRAIAQTMGLDEGDAGRWIAFWAGLHDLGKACPAFQVGVAPDRHKPTIATRLSDAGLYVHPVCGKAPHGIVSARALKDLLQVYGLSLSMAILVGTAVGGHHGVFPSATDAMALANDDVGAESWQRARAALAAALADLLALPRARPPTALSKQAAMWLAGLISVADWIGSDERYFSHAGPDLRVVPALDLAAYNQRAQTAAQQALDELGWLGWAPPPPLSFAALFPDIPAPRPVQTAAVEVADAMTGPGIVIVEAPMGEGKTEAALYLADHWSAAHGQRGCYVALPTQATSNQMFGRVRRFLERRYRGADTILQLLHGHAQLSEEFLDLLVREGRHDLTPTDLRGDDAQSSVRAAEWFTNKKRGLLAPFGVGTVDQALLGALSIKHAFVRLYGLSYRTVVVDEVHAYDTYMSTLLARLLEWLGAGGVSVVLLSATLPRATRNNLLAAYLKGAGLDPSDLPHAAYPRVNWACASGRGAIAVDTSERVARSLTIRWIDGAAPDENGDPDAFGRLLNEALAGGGCAAVICNTVRRAQQVYAALRPYFDGLADDGEPRLDLFHARFLFEEREAREQRVVRRFGRPGGATRRPSCAVLVATQVIEQSLDLDFDLMVSEIAPADLLLQRSGRLQRHERARPDALQQPTLWLWPPAVDERGVPHFGAGTEAVYELHALLRTWLALRARPAIAVPGEVEGLVEAVYASRPCPDELPPPLREAWHTTLESFGRAKEEDEKQATVRYIGAPAAGGPLWEVVKQPREEDAPEQSPAQQALTRLTEPTVNLICLFGEPERPTLDPEAREVATIKSKPSLAEVRRLLRRSVAIADRRIVFALLRREPPTGWQESAHLRQYRLIVLNQQGEAMIENDSHAHLIRVDADLGVVIDPPTGARP